MAKENNKQYNVVEKEQEEKETIIKWDDLIPFYKELETNINNATKLLKQTGDEFKTVIESDKELSKIYIGSANTIVDLTQELMKILKVHSKQTLNEETKKVSFNPFTGLVDVNNEKHKEVYLYVVMAYNGLSEKVTTVIENIMTTLLAEIEVVAKTKIFTEEDKKELDEIKNKEIEAPSVETETESTTVENKEETKTEKE